MKLRILTHAERDLRGTLGDLWPKFMGHDPIANAFWPRLYEVFPDFQFWVVDEKATIGYACTVPVNWDGLVAEQRGVDWALSDGQAGESRRSSRSTAARGSAASSCAAWRASRPRTDSTA